MLDKLRSEIRHWLLPSRHNDFHPHLLAERGLLILFALILGAEAFLVSNVVSTEAGTPALARLGTNALAAAANASAPSAVLPPGIAGMSQYWLAAVINPLARISEQPQAGRIAFFTLASIAAILMGLLAYTLSVRRRQFQTVGYMAGATMLLFAAAFLFFDMHYLFPGEVAALQAASAQAAVGQPPARIGNTPASAASSSDMGKIELFTSGKTGTITK